MLVMLSPVLCGAQWLWLDEAGRRVYSDQPPPPSVPAARVVRQPGLPAPAPSLASPPASAPPVMAQPAAPRLASAASRAHDDAIRRLEADNARLRAAHCARLRDALASLASGHRLARTLPNGEREVLDDAARAVERQRLQGLLASDCEGA